MWHTQAGELLSLHVFGNTVELYILSLAVFAGVLLGLHAFKTLALGRLAQFAKRTATDVDDFFVGLLRELGPMISILIALHLATRSLVLARSLEQLLHLALVVVLTIKTVHALQAAATFFLKRWTARAGQEDPTSASVMNNAAKAARVLLWLLGLLFVLDNLGVNVTSVLAGLGIGGVAVALAAQAVLGDAFSSFAIFVDKPFKVGDFIIVGDFMWTVEHVGFKTTRVRSLGGEQRIFPNSDLTGSRLRNYQRMDRRRVVFQLGVTYQTPLDQVKAIPTLLKEIIIEQKLAKFDRAHFQRYGDFALIFEIVYYVLTPDYNLYMDIQQAINLRIKETFEEAGIEFAYPTQQLYISRHEPAP